MTAVLAVVAAAAIAAVVLLLAQQQRLARRLVRAGQRLQPDIVPTGAGLAEATSVVERVVDRALLQGSDVSTAEARLAGALMGIPQGVIVFAGDGSIVFRNKVAAGYLTGRHGEALVEEAVEELRDAALADTTTRATRTVDLLGPPRRTLVLDGLGLEHGSKDVGALVVIDDVTERKRLEVMRRDFVANISHELKTPVGALGLLAETLASEDDPEVARRLAERMLAEAFRVSRSIDDLLELSNIEADDAASREDLDVDRVITEAVERVRGAAEQQGIAIEVRPSTDALTVVGDRRQLVSAVYNLLDNAVKYSDPGSTVGVRARLHGRFAAIEVQDHGIGIPGRDLERVFERFYRVDRARSRETGGTGLGLAIVRHVASNHAGEVRLDSTEGVGSTFTLRLPLAPSAGVDDEAGLLHDQL